MPGEEVYHRLAIILEQFVADHCCNKSQPHPYRHSPAIHLLWLQSVPHERAVCNALFLFHRSADTYPISEAYVWCSFHDKPYTKLINRTDLALAWSAMLWFDTTIFVLTLVQAFRVRRYFPGGLLEIMFRDGEQRSCPRCRHGILTHWRFRHNILRVTYTVNEPAHRCC